MSASRLFVATAVLAGLAVPATAEAAKGHSSPARQQASFAPGKAATTAARRYWGATPCGGRVKTVTRARLGAGVDPSTSAWATFATPMGANNLAAPAIGYRNCSIFLARWRWPTTASMSEDWDLLCATVIHETGHLLGRSHDARRGSVMAPVFDDASHLPRICRTMRPRAKR